MPGDLRKIGIVIGDQKKMDKLSMYRVDPIDLRQGLTLSDNPTMANTFQSPDEPHYPIVI
jgi:hypothetical protein